MLEDFLLRIVVQYEGGRVRSARVQTRLQCYDICFIDLLPIRISVVNGQNHLDNLVKTFECLKEKRGGEIN